MNTNIRGRAFDTSFEAHQGLLHKFARKGFGRLIQAGVMIDYEDVFQEMSVTYVKAVSKYDPETGISFSAYLGKAIWNEFNKFAEMETNHGEKILPLDDAGDPDKDDMDFYEVIDSGIASPERYAEVKQNMRENAKKHSRIANIIVTQLLNPTQGLVDFTKKGHLKDVSIGSIIRYHKITQWEARMAKDNLNKIYDIEL